MSTKRQPNEFHTVQAFCAKCGGWWFWAVDMPGCRNDIKKALFDASQKGDRIQWYPPGSTSEGESCTCNREATSNA